MYILALFYSFKNIIKLIVVKMDSKNAKNGIYGCISGVLVAAALQPLENIKMALLIPPKDIVLSSSFIRNVPIATKYLYNDGKI